MNTPFFITGQIRSRSAWLANFFTSEDALCFHDPNDGIEELMEQYPQFQVGISSSFLVTAFHRLIARFPESRWLYIDRDEQEAKRSLMKFTDGRLFGKDVDRILKQHAYYSIMMKDHRNTLVVDFAELDKRLCEASYHLFPTKPFQATRARILGEFKVEQRLGFVLNRLMKGTTCQQPG